MSSESGQGDHRCRSGRWCAARSGRDAAATAKPDSLCPACIDDIQRCRDKIDALRDALAVFVGIKPVTAQSSKIKASREPASPLNLAADTLISDIGEVMSRCGNYLIRDLVNHPAARYKVWRSDVEQIVFFDGVELALQVRSVFRRGVKLLGFEPVWQRRQARCPTCSMPCLGQFTGSASVQCSGCGHVMSDVDYHNYCVELVRGK